MTASLELTVDVAAAPAQTWAAVTDWARQGEWMLGTTVRATAQEGRGVGGRLEAWTGLGRLGFLDTMEISRWEPPYRCDVVHTGRVVRGTGTFVVRPGELGSQLVWREDLELPWGLIGRLGWAVLRALFTAGVRSSLRRFARWVSDPGTPPVPWPGTTAPPPGGQP